MYLFFAHKKLGRTLILDLQRGTEFSPSSWDNLAAEIIPDEAPALPSGEKRLQSTDLSGIMRLQVEER